MAHNRSARRRLAATLLALNVATTAAQAAENSCVSSPKLVGQCFAVHGRLFLANGTPSIRMWRVGTKRILGILGSNGKSSDENFNDLPLNVRKLIPSDPFDMNIYGDYTVCPLEREKPGWMQDVCIASATHLVSRPR